MPARGAGLSGSALSCRPIRTSRAVERRLRSSAGASTAEPGPASAPWAGPAWAGASCRYALLPAPSVGAGSPSGAVRWTSSAEGDWPKAPPGWTSACGAVPSGATPSCRPIRTSRAVEESPPLPGSGREGLPSDVPDSLRAASALPSTASPVPPGPCGLGADADPRAVPDVLCSPGSLCPSRGASGAWVGRVFSRLLSESLSRSEGLRSEAEPAWPSSAPSVR